MITCACCGRYTVEEVIRDRMRGAGPRCRYRLTQRADHGGVYIITEARSLDELVDVLDARGILMWPAEDDGCE